MRRRGAQRRPGLAAARLQRQRLRAGAAVAGTSRFFPFKLGRIRAAFEAGWSFPQWLQNRGWGVYLGIAVLLLLLCVYRV